MPSHSISSLGEILEELITFHPNSDLFKPVYDMCLIQFNVLEEAETRAHCFRLEWAETGSRHRART